MNIAEVKNAMDYEKQYKFAQSLFKVEILFRLFISLWNCNLEHLKDS